MTRIDSTKVLWRLEFRHDRTKAWRYRATFETRAVAREKARSYREEWGYLTRVVRHISGKGKAP